MKATPRTQRPRWWVQVALVGLVFWAYDAINNLNPFRRATAMAHGISVLHLENRLHLTPERPLNHWLAGHAGLGRLLADYYDTAHFTVTIAVLVLIFWRFPARYRLLRNALLGINAIGFLVFWVFPCAPPRMLPGFVDIVAVTHAVGAWSSGKLASQANEYAAMPSLHVAWALWCAGAVWLVRTDWWSRVAAAAYVVITSLAVMATANHFFLDVVAGAMTAALAAMAATWWDRSGARDKLVSGLAADRGLSVGVEHLRA
jgi:membrane-associated phospholipid phosphatase